jgi:hypothetical protein
MFVKILQEPDVEGVMCQVNIKYVDLTKCLASAEIILLFTLYIDWCCNLAELAPAIGAWRCHRADMIFKLCQTRNYYITVYRHPDLQDRNAIDDILSQKRT